VREISARAFTLNTSRLFGQFISEAPSCQGGKKNETTREHMRDEERNKESTSRSERTRGVTRVQAVKTWGEKEKKEQQRERSLHSSAVGYLDVASRYKSIADAASLYAPRKCKLSNAREKYGNL